MEVKSIVHLSPLKSRSINRPADFFRNGTLMDVNGVGTPTLILVISVKKPSWSHDVSPNIANYRQISPIIAKYRQISPIIANYRQISHMAIFSDISDMWRSILP